MAKKNQKKRQDHISDLMVLRLFLFNTEYRLKLISLIKVSYFNDVNMSDILSEVMKKYQKKMVWPKSIKGLVMRNPWGDDAEIIQEKLDIIDVDKIEMELIPLDDFIEDVRLWLQRRMHFNWLRDNYTEYEEGNDINFIELSEDFKKISQITFESDFGISIRDNKRIIDMYTNSSQKIKMNDQYWDAVTDGGCEIGTLNVLMGTSHVGKSRAMINMAHKYQQNPDNDILYITLEMSEKKVLEKFDSLLLNITTKELSSLSKKDDKSKWLKYMETKEALLSKMGNIYVKRYPASSASVADFSALLNNMRCKLINPKIIFIDYMGIGSAVGHTANNSHELGRIIAEQYRDYFESEGLLGWTSVQTYQGTQKRPTDMNMFDVAGSKAISATADLFGVIIQDKHMTRVNQQMIKLDKNRHCGITGDSIIYQIHHDKYKLESIGIRDKKFQYSDLADGEDVFNKNHSSTVESLREKTNKLKKSKNKKRKK